MKLKKLLFYLIAFLIVKRHISMNFEGIDTKIFFYSLGVNLILFFCAPVAQRIRASDYGSEGREFESLQARYKTAPKGSFFYLYSRLLITKSLNLEELRTLAYYLKN